MQYSCRFHLRPRCGDASRGGECLCIRIHGDEHNQVARPLVVVAGRRQLVRFGTGIVARLEIQNVLSQVHPGVKQVERADDARNAGGQREAVRSEIDLLPREADSPHDVGKQVRKHTRSGAVGAGDAVLAQQKPEILRQGPPDGIGNRERQWFCCPFGPQEFRPGTERSGGAARERPVAAPTGAAAALKTPGIGRPPAWHRQATGTPRLRSAGQFSRRVPFSPDTSTRQGCGDGLDRVGRRRRNRHAVAVLGRLRTLNRNKSRKARLCPGGPSSCLVGARRVHQRSECLGDLVRCASIEVAEHDPASVDSAHADPECVVILERSDHLA